MGHKPDLRLLSYADVLKEKPGSKDLNGGISLLGYSLLSTFSWRKRRNVNLLKIYQGVKYSAVAAVIYARCMSAISLPIHGRN